MVSDPNVSSKVKDTQPIAAPLLGYKVNPYPILAPNKMDFIHHEEVDVLDILALLPPPRKNVPFLRGADDDIAFAQKLQVCASLPCQEHHLLVEPVLELLIPVHVNLAHRERKGSKTSGHDRHRLICNENSLRSQTET